MIPRNLTIDDIKVGDSASFERTWSEKDVDDFARLSGDFNQLHTDEEYAKTTDFKRRIVHGMLVGSLCSNLVGMHIPGKRCLYLSQTLDFRKPVFIGDELIINGVVKSKSISTRLIEIEITVKNGNGKIVLDGTAKVRVLP